MARFCKLDHNQRLLKLFEQDERIKDLEEQVAFYREFIARVVCDKDEEDET